MEETGIVLETDGSTAKVKMMRSGGCEACSASGSCKAVSDSDNVITVANKIGATVGRHVIIEISSGVFLKATFLTYMLPVVMLFVGAALGGKYGPGIYSGMPADFWQATVGILFFGLAIVIIRVYDRILSRDKELMPVITKILD